MNTLNKLMTIQNFIVGVGIIVFLGYAAVLVYAFITMRVKKEFIAEAVESRQMTDSDRKVYYVIPWPKADEASWVERMKYEEQHPTENNFAYITEWSEYKDYHYDVEKEAQPTDHADS